MGSQQGRFVAGGGKAKATTAGGWAEGSRRFEPVEMLGSSSASKHQTPMMPSAILDHNPPLHLGSSSSSSSGALVHTRSTAAAAATVAAMESSEFEIPTLPNGTLLCLNIRSTWGDPFYVGLNGLELFDGSGHAVAGDRVAAIWYADAVNATNSETAAAAAAAATAAAHPSSSSTAGRGRGGGGSGNAGEDPIRVVENLLDGENQRSLN